MSNKITEVFGEENELESVERILSGAQNLPILVQFVTTLQTCFKLVMN